MRSERNSFILALSQLPMDNEEHPGDNEHRLDLLEALVNSITELARNYAAENDRLVSSVQGRTESIKNKKRKLGELEEQLDSLMEKVAKLRQEIV